MWKPVLVAAVLAAALIGTTSAFANQDELAQLDAQLPGTLVNDPSRLDWESYGADIERTAIVDESIPGGGAAIRIDVKRAGEFIYVAGTNVPLTKTVRRGDTITVGFYARTIDARTEDGNGVLRVRFQQNAEPFPGFGEQTLSIGREWDWYEVTADAGMTLRSKDGIVALQFGRTRQTIEIGQTVVVSGSDRIASNVPAAQPQPAAEPEPQPEATPVPIVREEPLIPEPLEGAGELLNDPRGGDWRIVGDIAAALEREEPAIWLNRATRFTVGAPSDDPDTLSLAVPLNVSIEAGDNLLIAVAGRTEQAITPDRRARVDAKIDDLEPGRGNFAQALFPLGEDWQLIRLRARSPRAYAPGGAELVLSFAGYAQIVDIGPVYVFRTEPTE
ncbi:MAG: hypothetical protein HKP43_01025 [Altererythrobacter sp.]|nr:hypothetical protein [Altererythrobacter sp.]NNE49067.1 hypothetical protein [Altererythrobacter sp.]NNF94152.1 hypothetical protein [Altererythrobacter sp.]NNK45192.1 hypothetical protein [Altererythrobacter sp.]